MEEYFYNDFLVCCFLLTRLHLIDQSRLSWLSIKKFDN